MRQQKPKRSWPRASGSYDNCQTPPYALDALIEFLPKEATIWEPAAGDRFLVEELIKQGFNVRATDVQTGHDFFKMARQASGTIHVTNPPYAIKYDWMDKCYSDGHPFALLMPLEMIGTAGFREIVCQRNRGVHVRIVLPRINFKMPNQGWHGKGAQFPTAWFCWKIPGLEHGEFSYYELDRAKVSVFHKQMKQAA